MNFARCACGTLSGDGFEKQRVEKARAGDAIWVPFL